MTTRQPIRERICFPSSFGVDRPFLRRHLTAAAYPAYVLRSVTFYSITRADTKLSSMCGVNDTNNTPRPMLNRGPVRRDFANFFEHLPEF